MSFPGITRVDTLARDARYALRLLRRSPSFTIAAVLTLALAIGVNAAVFSIVDAVLLRPLPYPEPERLAMVSRGDAGGTSVNGRTWELVRDTVASAQPAVFSGWTTGVNLVVPGGDAPGARYVQQQRAGHGFFATLGVAPMLGRGFTPEEDRGGGPRATVVSAALWRSFFNADPAIVGQAITLRGEPYTIVGVMPDGFQSGARADLWTPLRPSPTGEGEGENYQVILRLRDGASWAQTHGELARVAGELNRARSRPDVPAIALSAVGLQDGLTQAMRRPLVILWAAVGIVLLVACTNLAGLLLTRAAARTRELATRIALGSGRAAVVQQLVVESVVLGLLGGAAGVLFGLIALDALKLLAANVYEIWQPVALDGRAIAAAGALSLLASVLFVLAPALQASRLNVHSGLLTGGSRSIAAGGPRWPRRIVVVAQVALGGVLLVGAGLLVRTFVHLQRLDPGFDPNNVLTAAVSLEDARYRDRARVVRLFEESLARLEATSGIDSAAVALGLPYERILNLGFRHLDGPQAAAPQGSMTSATYVTSKFFETLRLAVMKGRAFDTRDAADSPPVVVVSDTFARTYFKDQDPVGRRILIMNAQREIVGVVADVQLRPGWGDNGPLAAMPVAYVPVTQVEDRFLRLVHGWFEPTFIVRSTLPFAETAAIMRRSLDAADPLLPFAGVRAMSEVKSLSLGEQRFLMALLVSLAAAAIVLAAVGIHGLIAASVAERTREMGIRMALGATVAQTMHTIAVPGIVLAAVGTAAGLAAASASTRLIRHFVWGVSPNDPLTFVSVAAALLTVAAAASFIPALRILRLDPATTLRQD